MRIQIEKCDGARHVIIFLASATHYGSTRGTAIPVTGREGS
jgi:hypothetical protein